MRTPNTFQIGSTTYTTREYCNARGITDNARILKIQWRINTYIRNHTIQQTIEELDRLVSLTTQKARPHKACGEKHKPDQPCKPPFDKEKQMKRLKRSLQLLRDQENKEEQRLTQERILAANVSAKKLIDAQTGSTPLLLDGIRPWQGTKKEREIAQQQKEAREAATRKMITQQHNGETETTKFDQRELLKQSEWMVNDTENPIENAIHQLAQALRNATRLTKELKENQKHIEHWKEITANLLNQETSGDRTKRYNRPEKVWSDT